MLRKALIALALSLGSASLGSSEIDAKGQFCNLAPGKSGRFSLATGPYSDAGVVYSSTLEFEQCETLEGGKYVKFNAQDAGGREFATNLVELVGYSMYDNQQQNNIFVYGSQDDLKVIFPVEPREIPDHSTRVFYLNLADGSDQARVSTGNNVIATNLAQGDFMFITTELEQSILDQDISTTFSSSINTSKLLATTSQTFEDETHKTLRDNNYYVILVGDSSKSKVFTVRGEPSFGGRLVPSVFLMLVTFFACNFK